MNDVPLASQSEVNGGQYADDLNGWTSQRSQNITQRQLQRSLNDIDAWARKWRIRLNPGKTQLVTFQKHKSRSSPPLSLSGTKITESSSMKILGLTFDAQGTYTKHCRETATRMSQRTALLRRISGKSWGANSKVLLQIYRQWIRPLADYGSTATFRACKSAKKLLQLQELRALRLALHLPRYTSNIDTYMLAGTCSILDRIDNRRDTAISKFHKDENIRKLNDKISLIQGNRTS